VVGRESVRWTELIRAFVASDRRKEDFLAAPSCTDRHGPRPARLPSHDRAVCGEMLIHPDIWVLSRTNGNRRVAEWAVWSDPVVRSLVILVTVVRGDKEMLLTERFLAVLAFEWEKVNEETGWVRALSPD